MRALDSLCCRETVQSVWNPGALAPGLPTVLCVTVLCVTVWLQRLDEVEFK